MKALQHTTLTLLISSGGHDRLHVFTFVLFFSFLSVFFPGVYILIAVGAVMMLVGFLGCYGAIQESQCLLGTVSASTF